MFRPAPPYFQSLSTRKLLPRTQLQLRLAVRSIHNKRSVLIVQVLAPCGTPNLHHHAHRARRQHFYFDRHEYALPKMCSRYKNVKDRFFERLPHLYFFKLFVSTRPPRKSLDVRIIYADLLMLVKSYFTRAYLTQSIVA